jgi:hypothetical protein
LANSSKEAIYSQAVTYLLLQLVAHFSTNWPQKELRVVWNETWRQAYVVTEHVEIQTTGCKHPNIIRTQLDEQTGVGFLLGPHRKDN